LFRIFFENFNKNARKCHLIHNHIIKKQKPARFGLYLSIIKEYINWCFLHKNPTNAPYMLTLVYSHCKAPTRFSPQGAILSQYGYLACARSKKYVSRCKY